MIPLSREEWLNLCPLPVGSTSSDVVTAISKNRLRDDHMDALVTIDELRNVEVRRDAGQHVGVVARHVFLLHQEFDHFAD